MGRGKHLTGKIAGDAKILSLGFFPHHRREGIERMNEERENGAQVEHEESSAEQGPEELPDPDREGPTPDSENEEAEEGSEGG